MPASASGFGVTGKSLPDATWTPRSKKLFIGYSRSARVLAEERHLEVVVVVVHEEPVRLRQRRDAEVLEAREVVGAPPAAGG